MATNALTLTDVVGQLQENNATATKTNKHLEDFFKAMERSRLDQLEALREMKKGGEDKGERVRTTERKSDGGMGFGGLLTGLLPFLAGLAAFGAAMGGLRGWEIGAIKSIATSLKSFTGDLVKGVRAIATSALKKLGIYKVQARDPLGKFAKGQQWNIVQSLQQYMRRLSKSISAFFAPLRNFFKGEGFLTKTFRFLGKYFDDTISVAREFGSKVAKLFAPIGNFFKFFAGGGAMGKAGGMVSKIMPYISKFGRYFTAFLKPIGVIFSFFAGFKAFQAKEGDIFDKLGAGVGAFLGDFFGGLGTLISKGLGWLLTKVGLKDLGSYFSNLDVGAIIREYVEKVFKGVKQLFSGDFSGGLSTLFSAFMGENSPLNTLILRPLSLAIDWLLKKFGWKDEDAPPFDIFNTISGWVDGVLNWLDVTWKSVKIFFKQMPDRISLYFEEAWLGMMTDLKIGWEKLSTWIVDLPNRIMIGALNYIKEEFPKTFSFLGGDSMLSKVQSSSDANQMASQERVTAIDTAAQDKTKALDVRRQALDDERLKATAPAPAVVAPGGGGGGGSTVNASTQVVTPPPRPKDQSDRKSW